MAALTIRTVKLAVVGGVALPVIGFTGRLSAASDDGNKSKLVRACDVPLYPTSFIDEESNSQDKPEPNAVQVQITEVRKFATQLFKSFMASYDAVYTKAQIGVDHSKATLDYVQTNPGELPRVGFISLATMGGVVLGYRGSILRKFLYATIGGISSAALCYPTFTVDLTMAVREDARTLWRENIGWPLEDANKGKRSKGPEESNVVENKMIKPKEDPGQSKAEDKDLYSTRS